MPDDLDRLFERLVSVLADDAPGRLAVPFPAAEVYERLVPYRSNRSSLKVATHQDYEMAVLRLLAGERGYASLEPTEVREALEREAGEKNPDTGLFRQFPDALLSLNRLAAERFLRRDRAYAPPPPPPPSRSSARSPPRPRRMTEMTGVGVTKMSGRNERRSRARRSSWPSRASRRASAPTAARRSPGAAK